MMRHGLTEFAIVLLGVFFTVAGAVMLVAPGTYFRWVSMLGPRTSRVEGVGRGSRWMAMALWTRFRGALLLAAMAWVAYHAWLRIR